MSCAAILVVGSILLPSRGMAEKKFFPATENAVPGSYGVTLFAIPAASAAPELARSVGGKLGYVYRKILNGFEIEMNEAQAERLSRHPWVKNVVQETYFDDPLSYTLPHCYQGFDTNTRSLPPLPSPGNPVPQQDLDCADPGPSGDCIDGWGIDRIDRAPSGPPRDETFSYRQAAASVTVFVIDTGVAATNREFDDASGNTRIETGIDSNCGQFPNPPPICPPGNVPCTGSSPGKGHGTHVAAILGGRTFGLAKGVNIEPIRALCNGYGTIAYKRALEWVLLRHDENAPTAVVSISGINKCYAQPNPPPPPDCTDSGVQLREAMVNTASRDNLLIVQSAGNQSFMLPPDGTGDLADACAFSFGDEAGYTGEEAQFIARIVVAAGSDENDGLWRTEFGEYSDPMGSNVGRCVDIFAPAAHIASAYYPVDAGPADPDEIVCQLSGTSMAAPHVSGVAAMILDHNPGIKVDELRAMLLNWAEGGALESNPLDPDYIGDDSPNLLLHWDPSNIMKDGFETGDSRVWVVSP